MSIDLRFPNISATTPEGQMAQMQSYMHQLVEQLNWALNTIDGAMAGNTSSVVVNNKQNETLSPEEAEDTFNSIKALIIKSADIVHAYEEEMKTSYNGEYVAISDFGTYLEQTNQTVTSNSKYTEQLFTSVQNITNDKGEGKLDILEKNVKDTNAYIRHGYLGDYPDGDLKGEKAHGIAVGETINGEYKKYAWFTSNRLSFWDGAQEAAYISSSKLYIKDAVFLGNVQFGKYKADTSDGLAFLWIGG